MMRKWSEEDRSDIALLLRAGASAAEIAAVFPGVSRNAVIGVVNRDKALAAIGFMRRSGERAGNVPYCPPQEVRKRTTSHRAPRQRKAAPARRPRSDSGSGGDQANPRMVDLEELRHDECRWPYGDGPFLFCGCKVAVLGKPYCAEHAERARGGMVDAPEGASFHGGMYSDSPQKRVWR